MSARTSDGWRARTAGVVVAALLASAATVSLAWAQSTSAPSPSAAPPAIPDLVAPAEENAPFGEGLAPAPVYQSPALIDRGIKAPVKTAPRDNMPVFAPPGTPGVASLPASYGPARLHRRLVARSA